MKRYKGAMTGGLENEIHGLKWYLEDNKTDHILLFKSQYLNFQFETQGGQIGDDIGCLEGITSIGNVTFTGDKTERKLEALQLALVTWWEYGIIIIVKYRKSLYKWYRNKKLTSYLGMKYNVGSNENLTQITLKTFKDTFKNLVEQNIEALSTISGVQDGDKIKSIALNWPKDVGDMEPWRAGEEFKDDESYITEKDASKIKAFVWEDRENKGRCLARSIINRMKTVKGMTQKSAWSQMTLTFSLSTVPYLFEQGAAFIQDGNSNAWLRRRKQMKNAMDFADRVLKRLLKKAKSELKRDTHPSLKDEMGEHRKFDKLRGFLALLYIQLHGFCIIVERGELNKYKKENQCSWDEAYDKMREVGFHLDDNADRTATYNKDYFALMLKTPLRNVYEESLSQRDKAILVLSRANELISNNLTNGEKWDDEGYLLIKYLHKNNEFSEKGAVDGEIRGGGGIKSIKRYIQYVLCPKEREVSKIDKRDPEIEKEYKKTNDELETIKMKRVEVAKKKATDTKEKKEKREKLTELDDRIRAKRKEKEKAEHKMDLYWLKYYNSDFEINPLNYNVWTPNKARCTLLPGHQDAICQRETAEVKEFVPGDTSGKKKTITREVMRVAFEFRQLPLGRCKTFQEFYEKLVRLYEGAYNGYTDLLSEYEERHSHDEKKSIETRGEDKIRFIGSNAYTYECENKHISYRMGTCERCGKIMMKSQPKPAKKSEPVKPGQKRVELISKDEKAPYKCDSGHTAYRGGTCQVCGKLLKSNR